MSDQANESREHRLPSQAGLDLVASLIREPKRWEDWLTLVPDRWDLFLKVFRQAISLELATGWETQTLLTELGCQIRTTDELGNMDEAQLQRCSEYFSWVESLTELLPSIAERRRVVSGAAMLFRDSAGELERCVACTESGAFSAFELLKLGEIDKAWLYARINLDGPIGDRTRLVRERNPFAKRTPHLSDERLDRFLDPVSDLDAMMRERIARHLELCTECRDARDARSAARSTSEAASVA